MRDTLTDQRLVALALQHPVGGAQRLVGRGDDQVFEHLGVCGVDCLRLDLDRDDLTRAVGLHGHHAAAGGGLDDLRSRLGL